MNEHRPYNIQYKKPHRQHSPQLLLLTSDFNYPDEEIEATPAQIERDKMTEFVNMLFEIINGGKNSLVRMYAIQYLFRLNSNTHTMRQYAVLAGVAKSSFQDVVTRLVKQYNFPYLKRRNRRH